MKFVIFLVCLSHTDKKKRKVKSPDFELLAGLERLIYISIEVPTGVR